MTNLVIPRENSGWPGPSRISLVKVLSSKIGTETQITPQTHPNLPGPAGAKPNQPVPVNELIDLGRKQFRVDYGRQTVTAAAFNSRLYSDRFFFFLNLVLVHETPSRGNKGKQAEYSATDIPNEAPDHDHDAPRGRRKNPSASNDTTHCTRGDCGPIRPRH